MGQHGWNRGEQSANTEPNAQIENNQAIACGRMRSKVTGSKPVDSIRGKARYRTVTGCHVLLALGSSGLARKLQHCGWTPDRVTNTLLR
jgi:hypothetical protein